jgi:putative alpha-1,2-mannosidase
MVIENWQHRNGLTARGLGETQLRLPGSLIGDVMESGALFSFTGSPTRVIVRVGVSFLSEQQACANAESEIGTATFDQIQAQSKTLWNERLSRIEIDVPHTPPNVTELLYSSLYRASLTPVSHFPILRARSLTCGAAHQEQCHRRGARRFSGHEVVLFRFIVLQVRLFYRDDM